MVRYKGLGEIPRAHFQIMILRNFSLQHSITNNALKGNNTKLCTYQITDDVLYIEFLSPF